MPLWATLNHLLVVTPLNLAEAPVVQQIIVTRIPLPPLKLLAVLEGLNTKKQWPSEV